MGDIVISCFDHSTNMVKPWARAGFECYCVDILHEKGTHLFAEYNDEGKIYKVGADIMEWLPPRGNIVFAAFFPPCTHVSNAGCNAWKSKGLGKLIEALQLFKRSIDLAEWCNCPYMIENPVGQVSTYWRKPDYIFEPFYYGDAYHKPTCLWIGKGFEIPDVKKKNIVRPVRLPEHKRRHQNHMDVYFRNGNLKGDMQQRRSVTPPAFAQAVFDSNTITAD